MLVYLISLAIIILLVLIIKVCYVVAPPSTAYIISGVKKNPRFLIGTGGLRIPFFERVDKVYLGQTNVDIKTQKPVPTHDFVDVNIDGVCKIAVKNNSECIQLAARHLLNLGSQGIIAQTKENLEGAMREIVGSIDLKELVTNRDAFSDEVQKKAEVNMNSIGMTILSCNIQNITDEKGLIEGLGADNTFKIRKEAAITKANAERDIKVAQSEAEKIANDTRVRTETEIAERNNELAIRKADLKKASDTKQAEADAAYSIMQQEQQKTVNIKTVDARIEQTKREQILSEEAIKITQNQLKSEINAKADADKYQIEIAAQAELEQQKRNAEAATYQAIKEAGCNKVAYAHHKDDVVETMLMSLIYEGRFHTFSPVTYLDRMQLSVIRPLMYMNEADVIGFVNKYDVPVVKSPCPADGYTKREYAKNLLRQLNLENPGAKERMFAAIVNGNIKGWPEKIHE